MTTAEVHQFLSSNPPRPKQKKIGTYKPVDLNNYNVVRDDVGDGFSCDKTIVDQMLTYGLVSFNTMLPRRYPTSLPFPGRKPS